MCYSMRKRIQKYIFKYHVKLTWDGNTLIHPHFIDRVCCRLDYKCLRGNFMHQNVICLEWPQTICKHICNWRQNITQKYFYFSSSGMSLTRTQLDFETAGTSSCFTVNNDTISGQQWGTKQNNLKPFSEFGFSEVLYFLGLWEVQVQHNRKYLI